MKQTDAEYLHLILEPIRACANYEPRFGRGAKSDGLSLTEFQTLYQNDLFYSWFGLDNPLMYAAHKAAGGMTSIYRQIGLGCERLFRAVLKDVYGLTAADLLWSYEVPLPNGKTRKLHLDGRIPLEKIVDQTRRDRLHTWMREYAGLIGVDQHVFSALTGVVFEVRQGYKSKDSKRQNADIANAAAAYINANLPCAVILSSQIDDDVLLRYRAEKWAVVTGVDGANNLLVSTYDFMREVIGYDLGAFFKRNSKTLHAEIDAVLNTLLTPGSY